MIAGEDNAKKNILIVHNYYQIPGGEDTVVANEKKMLENYGHKVVLYSRNNSELRQMSKLQKLALPLTTVFNPRTYREVKRLIREEEIDIVHVHNTLNLISPSVYYAARLMNVPVVQTIHNFRLLCPGATFYRDGHICEDCVSKGLGCALRHNCYRNNKLQTLICVVSTKIHRMTGIYGKINYICLTEFNKEKLLLLNQLEKHTIIHSGSIFIKPNFTYEGYSCQSRDYYLFIGRIERIKGLDVLIEAFSGILDVKLKIVGIGTDLENYKMRASKCRNIEFEGFMNRDSLNSMLSHAKAVIVASQWYETFGMVIGEAYASRVPVITGDIGNIGILVEDGVTGFKFQYDSALDLKAVIERFEQLSDEQIRNMGENAYNRYVNEFSEKKNYEMLLKIYDSVNG
mgnify:CR=1 FL=1